MSDFLVETTWSQMLCDYRCGAGLNKSALARAIGVSIGYISKLESGKRPPPEYQRRAICEALGLNEEQSLSFHIKAEMERSDPVAVKYLLSLVNQKHQQREISDYPFDEKPVGKSTLLPGDLTTIPVINKVAAGYPQEFTDLDYPAGIAESYIGLCDISDPNAFGFYVYGGSMEPEFPDETLLIASPNTVPFDGNPCFVRFSPVSKVNGCTFKKVYYMSGGRIRLVPINRRYVEQVCSPDDIMWIWPVIRSYGKINRGPEGIIGKKTKSSGRKPESVSNWASAAG